MSTVTHTVVGMSCSHCARSVEAAVGEIAGVTSVAVDLKTGLVTVSSETPVTDDAFAAAIDDAGYEVAS